MTRLEVVDRLIAAGWGGTPADRIPADVLVAAERGQQAQSPREYRQASIERRMTEAAIGLREAEAVPVPTDTPEQRYWAARACWACGRYGWCAHREMNIARAEAALAERRNG